MCRVRAVEARPCRSGGELRLRGDHANGQRFHIGEICPTDLTVCSEVREDTAAPLGQGQGASGTGQKHECSGDSDWGIREVGAKPRESGCCKGAAVNKGKVQPPEEDCRS